MRAVPREVIGPTVVAGVEQPDQSRPRGLSVNPGQVRAFVSVAVHAGVRQVPRHRPPTMLASDDVLELEPAGEDPLRDQAVLAAEARSLLDELREGLIHGGAVGSV
jgi:hypothetical protein